MSAGDEIRGMANKFAAAPAKAVTMIRQATVKTTIDTAADARRNAPVDTGYLRSTIATEYEFSGDGVIGSVEAGANYAVHVENGTSRMAPQPFLRPAFDKHREKWIRAMEQVGAQVIQ